MVCAKTIGSSVAFPTDQDKEAKRTYIAVVRGNIKDDRGHIETLIDRDPKDRMRMAVVLPAAALP